MATKTLTDATYRVRHGLTVTVPVVNDHGDLICPVCGNDDLSLWADDGEADLADWWDCQRSMGGCGAEGALVFPEDESKTQNGCAVTVFYTGEWLLTDPEQDDVFTYAKAYEGIPAGSWSGGYDFWVTRAVMEEIIRDQEIVVTGSGGDADVLEWDGDVVVQKSSGLDEENRLSPDAGHYHVGFGWTWYPLPADEKPKVLIHSDGRTEEI